MFNNIDVNKLASVLVFCYQNTRYLKENIDSILKQKYSPIEIIIRDDGSNDFDEEDIKEIKSYIEKNKGDNIVNYIIEKSEINEGGVKNLNKGIKLSKGKYILPLECDDCFYDENVVSNIVEFFEKEDYIIATSYEYTCDKNMNKIKIRIVENWMRKLLEGNPLKLYLTLCKGNFISGSHLYYTKEFINRYGLYDEDYKQLGDYPKLLSITRQKCMIGIIEEITIHRRGGGISKDASNYNLDENRKKDIRSQLHQDLETLKKKEVLPYFEEIEKIISSK